MLQFACSRFASTAEFVASDCACSLDPTVDAALIESVLDQASDMLMLLSGGRIHGLCTKTVYPVGAQNCLISANPFTLDDYTTIEVQGIPLRGPNTVINWININGTLLAASDYTLLKNGVLLRNVGNWPSAVIPSLTPGFSINFSFGRTPDFITKIAAIELACELAQFTMTGASRLPSGVTAANIQGVSISLRDRAEQIREGTDLIPAVARFLGLYAPDGLGRSGVWSPELDGDFTLYEV